MREEMTRRDAARVEAVYLEHRRLIENVARQHAHCPDAVPDIVQTVAMQLCKGLNGFRGDAELSSWIYRITVNVARDNYRAEVKHLRVAEAMQRHTVEPEEHPDDEVISHERLDALQAAIERLRPTHRGALQHMLRNQTRLVPVSSPVKVGTLKTRRFRARHQLRKMLADDPRFE